MARQEIPASRIPHTARAVTAGLLLAASLFAGAGVFEKGLVRVRYEEADRELAAEAVAVLDAAVEEFAPRLPAGDKPILVAICHTVREFERYAGPYAQPGVCGVADSEAGVIAVKAPELLPPGGDVTGTLRHELVHVLLARNVRIDRMPRWLNEGIAMTQAREYRWESGFRVAQMYFQNRLLTYDALELSFLEPGREMEFGDAYAQALSMTRFLKDELGEERFWRVVSGLNTATFPEALEQHGSMSLEELSEAWRGSLWQVALVFSIVSGFSIFQVMAVLTIMAYLRKRRQGRLRMRRWEEEDAEDDRFPPFMTVRELEDQDGPYPWEEDEDGGYL